MKKTKMKSLCIFILLIIATSAEWNYMDTCFLTINLRNPSMVPQNVTLPCYENIRGAHFIKVKSVMISMSNLVPAALQCSMIDSCDSTLITMQYLPITPCTFYTDITLRLKKGFNATTVCKFVPLITNDLSMQGMINLGLEFWS